MARTAYFPSNEPLTPYWITGFTAGEGSFYITQSSKGLISACFAIHLHSREVLLLNKIQVFFKGVGRINQRENSVELKVRGLSDLLSILPHFQNYPLEGFCVVSS
jgi:hypothetical protein